MLATGEEAMGTRAVGLGDSNWKDRVVCGCVRGLSAGSWRDLDVFIFLFSEFNPLCVHA